MTLVTGSQGLAADILAGWYSDGTTWTYSSVDDPIGVFTVSGDKTAIYYAGMKIKMTNGGNTIYGIITKVTYSAPNSSITFLHEIDPTDNQALYLLANSAITNNFISSAKCPAGFPIDPIKWTIKITDSTDRTQTNPVQNTWYNVGTTNSQITIPIGCWHVSYKVNVYVNRAAAGIVNIQSTLSTANNSESDTNFTGASTAGADLGTGGLVYVLKQLNITSKTIYYLNARSLYASQGTLYFINSYGDMVMLALCAYL